MTTSPPRRLKTTLNIVVLALVALAVAAWCTDLILEFLPFPNPGAIAARRRGIPFDARDRSAVIDSLRRAGQDAWPAVIPAVAWGSGPDADAARAPWGANTPPLGGVARAVTVFCNETSRYTIYRSDAAGFANPGAPDSASAGGVALLGDSFMQGACVPADSSPGSLLRLAVPDARSWAMSGNGPLLELATLREVVAPLRPRVVFWCYYEGNDLDDLRAENRDPRLRAYLDPAHRGGVAPDSAVRQWLGRVRVAAGSRPGIGLRSRLRNTLTLFRLRQRFGGSNVDAPAVTTAGDVALFASVLARARDDVRAWGGTMVFVYLPAWERYYAKAKTPPWRNEILGRVRAMGIDVVDLDPVFSVAAGRDSLFGRGKLARAHYSGAGYARMAGLIADRLASMEPPPTPAPLRRTPPSR